MKAIITFIDDTEEVVDQMNLLSITQYFQCAGNPRL